ncbi:D-isomer specific 2-hydroxyacid dehydrogenase [Zychaea mexicana]|uniref:D-isomer specific 2-hydroxyacid dehydrogenase n=1 Tax=Zychaea mexicana TaxID=64656 RepID=UPI0022FE8C75|nr:D-isomer specific 2-hydroxyacid dehydrogenase [Zychaea mexicana]KAI9479546.1 D-isomer specific 2-hydroxyacid dehydrogenase [Zychaea mexicana]
MMPQGLIVGQLICADQEKFDGLMERLDIQIATSKTRTQLFADFAEKYKNVKAVYLSIFCAKNFGPFDKEFIEQLPKSAKYICYAMAGYDLLDVAACTARNIYVSHVENMVDAPSADIAVYLILASLRNATQYIHNVREGRWKHGVPLGNDPEGKTLGILGMGGIGKALAKRMRAFDMNIQYNNRRRLDPEVEAKYDATYVTFDNLLRTSDVIFVSVPLNDSTYHLLDAPQFAKMKSGVIIINTARGPIISEDALVAALETGKVAAAGLDVFEKEPDIHPGLLAHPRSTLLPHIASSTKESLYNMDLATMKNMEAALVRDTLLTPIPEHKHMFETSQNQP